MQVQEHVFDTSDYSDQEELIDLLVATSAVLILALNRKQPKYLEDEMRSVLGRVMEQIKIDEDWVH